MVQASDVRKDMEVRDNLGAHVGTVDGVEGDRIKLTRKDSADGLHHYVPLSAVDRVDTHVHLTAAGAALLTSGPATAAYGSGTRKTAVGDTAAGRKSYLPWIIGAVVLLLLLLLLKGCFGQSETKTVSTSETTTAATTAALPVETVKLPNGSSVDVSPNTLNYELQRYLESGAATPRTFTFDKLNFDTGSAKIRAEDEANVDALAQILVAYPKAAGRVVGYTDARGSAGANANLGKERADAVVAALGAKGVTAGRVSAASGGETNPADTNATTDGQFENRRTELVVTAK